MQRAQTTFHAWIGGQGGGIDIDRLVVAQQ